MHEDLSLGFSQKLTSLARNPRPNAHGSYLVIRGEYEAVAWAYVRILPPMVGIKLDD